MTSHVGGIGLLLAAVSLTVFAGAHATSELEKAVDIAAPLATSEPATQAAPPDSVSLTVASVGPRNPRNSEAAIIQLKDGSLLLGWTEFYAGSAADHGPARIVGRISRDGGRTWDTKYTLVENDGGCNVMEVNFLRLKDERIALFHCQKNTEETDCRVMMRVSSDEGRTWGPAKQLSPAGKYTGLTNGRGMRLKSGRILLEAWEDGFSYCYLSDDEGRTWRESQRVKPRDGCWEPACIELKNDRVMMLLRTGMGGQYKSVSRDGGETWTNPSPTPLVGTAAPVSISRIPKTGDLLAIWNHNPGAKKRNPLTAAISKDEGETWEHFRDIENAPDDAWAYPAVIWIKDQALLTYFNYTGGLSLKLRILPAAWFYR
jgi:sialidase-1